MIDLKVGQKVHFVGIGGFGLSAIARIMLQRGLIVSGSDRKANAFTHQLSQDNATIYIGNSAEHVGDVDFLVVSSAIARDDAEISEAHKRNIPVYKRADILESLMQGKVCIAIAGTHGKTTTTAMVIHILRECGQDPSYIVGGVMANTGDNARHGTGNAFVIEADEYDNMFHGLRPKIAVVTSMEYDHPDFFQTPQEMTDSFNHFVGLIPADGQLIVCKENASRELQEHTVAPVITYGDWGATWRVSDLYYKNDYMQYKLYNSEVWRILGTLQVYGEHNAFNATAAVIVAQTQGITLEDATHAMSNFKGTGRRFELRADIHEIAIIDDYAHHPTAIKTTIDAARKRYPNRQVWAVWQPHTFSRTRELMDEYAQAFVDAHHVLVTDIFASRETLTDSIHSRDVIAKMTHPDALYSGTLANTADILKRNVQSPAVILIMSAGDAPEIGVLYLADLQDNNE